MGKLLDLFRGAGSRPPQTDAAAGRPLALADYMRGNMSPFMLGWRPILREPSDDVMRSWTDAAARVIDAMHNSGTLSGAVDQGVANIMGTGLRLNATPDPEIFGGNREANIWARKTERRFNDYACDKRSCDLGGRYTLHQLCAHGLRSIFATGEMVGTIPYVERPGSTHGTKMNLVPSSRLAQSGAQSDVVQGVRLDRNGCPAGYIFMNRDPQTRAMQEVEVAPFDSEGRPLVFHIFDGLPTSTRGITPLAPVIQVIRQIDQLQNATLTASLIQAIFAASIQSDAPTEEVMDALRSAEEQARADGAIPADAPPIAMPSNPFDAFMAARFKWYGKTKIDLGQFGKVFHAFPGEELKFHTANHPNANYKDFIRTLQMEVARCVGVTYEQFSLNNDGATYNSLNNETADIYEISKYRRVNWATPFMHTAYTCWLEEDIERGLTEFPGGIEAFQRQKIQATRADWQGPPRPTADEKKTAEANEIKLRNKAITRAGWCADMGTSWQDNDEQELQEQEHREELGLPAIVPVTNTPTNTVNGGRPTGPGANDDDPPDDPDNPKDE